MVYVIEIKQPDGRWWRLIREYDTAQRADRFVAHFRSIGWTARIVPSDS